MKNIKTTKNFVLEKIKQTNKFNGGNLIYQFPDLINDDDILFAAAKRGLDLKEQIPNKILENRNFIKILLSSRGGFENFNFLKERNSKFCNDREILLIALKRAPETLRYMKEDFKNDEQIVMHAIKSWKPGQMFINPIQFSIGKKLGSNRNFILKAIKYWGGSIFYASKKLINDKKLFFKAIKLLKKQKEGIDLIDVKRGRKYLKDKKFVDEVIEKNPIIYEIIDRKLKMNKKITILAVRGAGRYLMYAPKKMRADRDVVLNSFKDKSMDGLEYMDKKFKDDTQLILHAIKNCGSGKFPHLDDGEWFWKCVDKKLLKNKSFLLKAMKCNPTAYAFVDRVIFNDDGKIDKVDPDILKAREDAHKKSYKKL